MLAAIWFRGVNAYISLPTTNFRIEREKDTPERGTSKDIGMSSYLLSLTDAHKSVAL